MIKQHGIFACQTSLVWILIMLSAFQKWSSKQLTEKQLQSPFYRLGSWGTGQVTYFISCSRSEVIALVPAGKNFTWFLVFSSTFHFPVEMLRQRKILDYLMIMKQKTPSQSPKPKERGKHTDKISKSEFKLEKDFLTFCNLTLFSKRKYRKAFSRINIPLQALNQPLKNSSPVQKLSSWIIALSSLLRYI